jgi:hypothetical protein
MEVRMSKDKKVEMECWNAGVFKFKCDHGTGTEDFYLPMEVNVAVSDGNRKRSADTSLIQTTPKGRAPPDYKEKDSNEFKVADNLNPDGCCNYEMEGVNFDYLSDVSIPGLISRRRGRPAKFTNHPSTARFQ